ncbi:MAG: hypothetical protein CME00_08270 [Geminicoccus sp.]|nr:hypothetical protein [Geminicoccus sp.]
MRGLVRAAMAAAVAMLMLLVGPLARAHPAELNNRVMFIVTSLEITEVLGEEALVVGAVLDNGLRNRLTLRGLSSTAGTKTRLYSTKKVYGQDNLIERRTFALRSGQGRALEAPDFVLAVTGLTDAVRNREAFEITLTFNRAVGELTLPVSFEVDETGVYGFAEIDMGAPKALSQDYEWIRPEGEGGGASDPASNGG